MLDQLLILGAVICFLAATFRLTARVERVDLIAAGLLLWALSALL